MIEISKRCVVAPLREIFPMALPSSPFLYPILDSGFSDNLIEDARIIIEAGASIFQVRAKNLSKQKLFEIIETLHPLCASKNTTMIVNDSVDVAMVSNAAGVHLGQEDFPVFEARKLLDGKIIGYSTHNLEQVCVADTLPVNYIAIGPVFPTSTKRGAGRMLGLSIVAEARTRTKRPLICIGGIQMQHFRELFSAGADGVAFISELYKPPGLQKNIYRLLEEIDACRSQRNCSGLLE